MSEEERIIKKRYDSTNSFYRYLKLKQSKLYPFSSSCDLTSEDLDFIIKKWNYIKKIAI